MSSSMDTNVNAYTSLVCTIISRVMLHFSSLNFSTYEIFYSYIDCFLLLNFKTACIFDFDRKALSIELSFCQLYSTILSPQNNDGKDD